ncbi:MAG: hypothetical protein WC096_00875 [Sphaerochaetaceae bacterium]
MLQKFVESLLVAGTITALLIELVKQQWKRKYGETVKKDAGGNEVHTVSPFPSWLGLVLGAGVASKQVFTVSGTKTYAAGALVWDYVLPPSIREWTGVAVACDDNAATGALDVYLKYLGR